MDVSESPSAPGPSTPAHSQNSFRYLAKLVKLHLWLKANISHAFIVFMIAIVGLIGCNRPSEMTTASTATDKSPSKLKAQSAPLSPHKPSVDHSGTQLPAKYRSLTRYVDFRRQLISDGWAPMIDVNCREKVVGAAYNTLCAKDPTLCDDCRKLPELSACSSDGYCSLRFRKGSDVIAVGTYGDLRDVDSPGRYGLGVVGWNLLNKRSARRPVTD